MGNKSELIQLQYHFGSDSVLDGVTKVLFINLSVQDIFTWGQFFLQWILQAAISFHQIIHTWHAEILYANIRQLQKQE